MKEIWKVIEFREPNFDERFRDKYEVSNAGNIRRKGKQQLSRPFKSKQTGRLIVNLIDDDTKTIQPPVSKLVYNAFLGYVNNANEIIHKDGQLDNCYVWNLTDTSENYYMPVCTADDTYEDEYEASMQHQVPITSVRRCCKGIIKRVPTENGNIRFQYKRNEVWGTHPDHPTLLVSTEGRIKSEITEEYIKDMPTDEIALAVCKTFIAEVQAQQGVEYEPKFGVNGEQDCSFHNLRWGRV